MRLNFTFLALASFLMIGVCHSNPVLAKKEEKKTTPATKDSLINSALVSGLKFRNIGPAWASGRIADFAVNPDNNAEYFVGVASGNVWKTVNNGTSWTPVFDNYGAYSIGDVELDPNNHNVVWVGTGENNHQRALGYGDGIYKSLDGGKSFKNMGLKESRQIGGIVIDPRNSDVVFVACEGSAWGPGGDRGLFKTTDGGTTWKKVLEISENTGVNNIVSDPSNPDILYATSEQRRRTSFGKIGGGPESAVYKSTDNGETWHKIMEGLPKVDIGGMGLAVSPVDPNVVYVIVEAQENKGGFFRSTNKGESWDKMSEHSSSGQYYNEIYCDPKDVDKVFSVETFTQYSEDAGKTWKRLSNNKRHVDDHALWIDPKNTDHVLVGGDGGIYESYDMGENWDFKENLPVTQFYRVAVDNAEPFYNVYGGTQDNNSMGGPSQNTSRSGVTSDEWIETLGGDGFWQAIDPTDPNIVYSEYQYGNVYRYDKKSGERIDVKPRERKGEEAYKWNWNAPMIISPNSNTRLYCAANKVFRSDDRGNSWTVISEDLTAKVDRNSLKMMDKFWSADAVVKHMSTSQWGTIVAFDESRVQEGLLYAGTDDGVISVTEDNGKNWFQIKTFPGVPQYTWVSDIQADKFDANVVYATFDNLKRDDFAPYVLKSSDKGRTWTSIVGNLPEKQSVHTVQQDFKKQSLLFAGTEFGIYFTIDGGKNWEQLKSGIPTIAVFDITIQERECDLVVASFGRGMFILDNYSPLRDLSIDMVEAEAKIFPVKDAVSFVQKSSRDNQGSSYYFAKNPEYGATITYYLKDVPKTNKEIRQEKEKELFKKGEYIPQPTWREMQLEEKEEKPHLIFTISDRDGNIVNQITKAPAKGVNQITWGLNYPSPVPTTTDTFDPTKDGRSGRPAMPGKYSVKMELWSGGELKLLADAVPFEVKKLNMATLPATNLKELDDFNRKIANMISTTEGAERLISELAKKVETIKQSLYNSANQPSALMEEARNLAVEMEGINFKMQGVPERASWEEIPPAQMPISKRVSEIVEVRDASTGAVTQTEREEYAIVKEELVPVLDQLRVIVEKKLPALEKGLNDLNAPWTPGRIPVWKD